MSISEIAIEMLVDEIIESARSIEIDRQTFITGKISSSSFKPAYAFNKKKCADFVV